MATEDSGTRIVSVQRARLSINPSLDSYAQQALVERKFQSLFEKIQDEVVRELVSYGIPDEHLSQLSANLVRLMMNTAIRNNQLR